jgi:hypothetical protein
LLQNKLPPLNIYFFTIILTEETHGDVWKREVFFSFMQTYEKALSFKIRALFSTYIYEIHRDVFYEIFEVVQKLNHQRSRYQSQVTFRPLEDYYSSVGGCPSGWTRTIASAMSTTVGWGKQSLPSFHHEFPRP